jgi:hypothetical protein
VTTWDFPEEARQLGDTREPVEGSLENRTNVIEIAADGSIKVAYD